MPYASGEDRGRGGEWSGCWELLKLVPAPGEEVLEPPCGMIGQAGEDVGEPGLRVDAVQLRGFDQRVYGGRAFATAIRAGEGPVVATDRDPAQGSLGGVVGDADPAISQEPAERRPALEGVVDRLADLGLARCAITLGAQPGLERMDDPRRVFPAHLQACLGAVAIDLAFDREQPVDPGHGLRRDRRL